MDLGQLSGLCCSTFRGGRVDSCRKFGARRPALLSKLTLEVGAAFFRITPFLRFFTQARRWDAATVCRLTIFETAPLAARLFLFFVFGCFVAFGLFALFAFGLFFLAAFFVGLLFSVSSSPSFFEVHVAFKALAHFFERSITVVIKRLIAERIIEDFSLRALRDGSIYVDASNSCSVRSLLTFAMKLSPYFLYIVEKHDDPFRGSSEACECVAPRANAPLRFVKLTENLLVGRLRAGGRDRESRWSPATNNLREVGRRA